MAVSDYLQYSQGNASSTTLSSGVANSDTSAPLTSDTAFSAKSGEGMVIINEGTADEELAYATGKSGGALTIPADNRGLEGGSAQTHASGASVKGILSAGMWNNVIDALALLIDKTTGAIKSGISFTSPKIVTGINDTNGNELIKVTATASAVNELTLANGATGNNPILSATGGDANIGITLLPKGTGLTTIYHLDGWIAYNDTWTYASATTFTIAGRDETTKFTKGTKIRMIQGGSLKYFYVVSSAFSTNTTVTVTGGSEYSIANEAISAQSYSYFNSPPGFPGAFATGTVTWDTTKIDNGTGGQQPGVAKSYFSITGNKVTHWISLAATNIAKNTAGAEISFTIPSTMPAPSATFHPGVIECVGSGFFGGIYLPAGIMMQSTRTVIALRHPAGSSISDNQDLTHTSCTYSYMF